MRPINFPSATHHFGAPKNWDPAVDGECAILPVEVVADPNVRCVSVWMPSEADRQAIAEGKPIALSVIGSQPVVGLYVVDVEEIPMPTNQGGTA